MAAAGVIFALTGSLPALVVAALTGTVSTDVVESGPFTSLEQAMLPHTGGDPTRLFGTYNTVATLAGSVGALIAVAGSSAHWLLAYPLAAGAGLVAAAGLSPAVERGEELDGEPLPPLHRSRGIVLPLSTLFALDSFGGGFVPQTFIAYLFARKYDASAHTLAFVFFAIGLLQALSFRRRSGSPAGSGCCGQWSSPTAFERALGSRRLRPRPGERDRAAARPFPALTSGRPNQAGVRRRRRLPERADRCGRVHE